MSKAKRFFSILVIFMMMFSLFAEDTLEEVLPENTEYTENLENSDAQIPETDIGNVEITEEDPYYAGWKITVPNG